MFVKSGGSEIFLIAGKASEQGAEERRERRMTNTPQGGANEDFGRELSRTATQQMMPCRPSGLVGSLV
jgi:hypothetical protein